MHFYGCIMTKTSHPPLTPKVPHGGGECIYLKVGLFLSPKKDIYLYEKNCKGIESLQTNSDLLILISEQPNFVDTLYISNYHL